MAESEDLQALSSKELHDRAMKVARHHLDARFVWNLLKIMPEAEAAAGNMQQAESDVVGDLSMFNSPVGLLNDLLKSDEGELADALRPYYIEYLQRHAGHSHDDEEAAGDAG
ncbi:MAG TPA: hypothetical protein VEM41_07360 [Actinomycetota bacterium]|jgi:hypothetical protein|nr:hypothetical protein [Actinomycetota bacterium]